MTIHDLVAQKGNEIFHVSPDASVEEAVKLMNNSHVGALIVLDKDGNMAGILSERDILRRMEARCEERAVASVMTPKEQIVIGHEEDSLQYAMKMFTENRIRHLPILRGQDLVAVISIGDVVRALLADEQFEKKHLMEYITGSEFA